MSGVEALESVKPIDPAELEYKVRYTGKAKYAIVLSGGDRDTVVGWGYNLDSAIKMAETLNQAEITMWPAAIDRRWCQPGQKC